MKKEAGAPFFLWKVDVLLLQNADDIRSVVIDGRVHRCRRAEAHLRILIEESSSAVL